MCAGGWQECDLSTPLQGVGRRGRPLLLVVGEEAPLVAVRSCFKEDTAHDHAQTAHSNARQCTWCLQERKKAVEAEEALARRRRVVADLAIKSKATMLQVHGCGLVSLTITRHARNHT